ncbi:MAG: hypothetical protein ABI680_20855 [Chthoniobacteraceae bacterium]
MERDSLAIGDRGFLSRFSLMRNAGPALRALELFIPGICYRKNANVPAHAIAADLTEEDIVVREDRMPLPLVMLRDPADDITASIIHLEPDGATCAEDANPGRLIDERLQFASLGVQGQRHPS